MVIQDGTTPLLRACKCKQIETAVKLIGSNACLNEVDEVTLISYLQVASMIYTVSVVILWSMRIEYATPIWLLCHHGSMIAVDMFPGEWVIVTCVNTTYL